MRWMLGATNEHAGRPVSEEQRSSRSKGKPPFPYKGKGRADFRLQLRRPFARVTLLRRTPGSLFRSEIGPANTDIIYAGLSDPASRSPAPGHGPLRLGY